MTDARTCTAGATGAKPALGVIDMQVGDPNRRLRYHAKRKYLVQDL
jgi:hypothetical protein